MAQRAAAGDDDARLRAAVDGGRRRQAVDEAARRAGHDAEPAPARRRRCSRKPGEHGHRRADPRPDVHRRAARSSSRSTASSTSTTRRRSTPSTRATLRDRRRRPRAGARSPAAARARWSTSSRRPSSRSAIDAEAAIATRRARRPSSQIQTHARRQGRQGRGRPVRRRREPRPARAAARRRRRWAACGPRSTTGVARVRRARRPGAHARPDPRRERGGGDRAARRRDPDAARARRGGRRARRDATFDPIEELTDHFYIVLAELHVAGPHVGGERAADREDDARRRWRELWSKALDACEARGERVDDAYGRRLRLSRAAGRSAVADRSARRGRRRHAAPRGRRELDRVGREGEAVKHSQVDRVRVVARRRRARASKQATSAESSRRAATPRT